MNQLIFIFLISDEFYFYAFANRQSPIVLIKILSSFLTFSRIFVGILEDSLSFSWILYHFHGFSRIFVGILDDSLSFSIEWNSSAGKDNAIDTENQQFRQWDAG